MLKKLQTQMTYHLQAATNSFNFLYRKPLATLFTVMVIAIALTLPALFWVFTDNLRQLTIDWQRGGHISLYLKSSLTPTESDALLRQVMATDGVGWASLKTAKEGALELQQQEGMAGIMTYLPDNPLPAVIDIIPAASINTPVKIKILFDKFKSLPQIDQAKLDMEWVTRLHAILSFVTKIAHAMIVLLVFAVVLIVGNTQRLAIHYRREEIQVLKLIGATDAFILRPFLYSGVWYGIIGAIFALLFVNGFMVSVAFAVSELAAVYHMNYRLQGLSIQQAYIILLTAICLGWLGAKLSVKRQLTSIEPYK